MSMHISIAIETSCRRGGVALGIEKREASERDAGVSPACVAGILPASACDVSVRTRCREDVPSSLCEDEEAKKQRRNSKDTGKMPVEHMGETPMPRAGGTPVPRLEKIDFDASSRHATHLVVRLRELLTRHDLRPAQVNEVYVSAGPGSFTGVRVGITVARTLAQAVPGLRCVSVPSAHAVAQNTATVEWQNLGVVLDAKEELVYAQLFHRGAAGEVLPAVDAAVMPLAEFIRQSPKPLLLSGEGLMYHKLDLPQFGDVSVANPSIYYPTAESVWLVGRRLAAQGQFTEYHHLLPIYARKSEAERLWDLRHPRA